MAKIQIPSPANLGLPPAKFSTWRDGQEKAISDMILREGFRFTASMQPTGFGKSAVYVAAALILDGKTVILTSTKALQSQLMRDFETVGMKALKGQNAYPCRATTPQVPCNIGPCHYGFDCKLKMSGCYYYDAVREARSAALASTNYAYWMTANRFADIPWEPDLLIMDEAHQAPNLLADFLTVTVEGEDLAALGETLPRGKQGLAAWIAWATEKLVAAKAQASRLSSRYSSLSKNKIVKLTKLTSLIRALESLTSLGKPGWIVSDGTHRWAVNHRTNEDYVRFGPRLLQQEHIERYLFGNVPRIYMTSGTISHSTMRLLLLSDYRFFEGQSNFPVERRPVYFIPTARITRRLKLNSPEAAAWLSTIDEIIDERKDRKGIIHTVSYAYRDHIVLNSRHSKIMFTNRKGNLPSVISMFKERNSGAVLVSPSLTSGYDFPGDDCRYQIIAKLPFPNLGDKLLAARIEAEPELLHYMTMQALVQAIGRGMRNVNDMCETFIVDSMFREWYKKWKHLAPSYFRAAVKTRYTPPPALSLTKGGRSDG